MKHADANIPLPKHINRVTVGTWMQRPETWMSLYSIQDCMGLLEKINAPQFWIYFFFQVCQVESGKNSMSLIQKMKVYTILEV